MKWTRSGAVKFHPALDPLMVPIDEVVQHPDNYNGGDIAAIAESIEVNGMYRPIFVQKDTRFILAGNHTWEACKTLGSDVIPVVVLDVNDDEAVKVMIADNRIASLAKPDLGLLENLLNRVESSEGDLYGTGYEQRDLEAIRLLNEMPVEHDEFAQWPTISVQVPPHVRAAYLKMTREADDDRSRFELLLRLAGWDGS